MDSIQKLHRLIFLAKPERARHSEVDKLSQKRTLKAKFKLSSQQGIEQ